MVRPVADLIHTIDTAVTNEQVQSYLRDGFLHLKGVLEPQEIQSLQMAVELQIKSLNSTTTGYDFEALANQLWSNAKGIESGRATRFELELYRHLIETDVAARPLRDKTNTLASDKGMFFYDAAGWRKHHEIRDVAFDSVLPKICSKLLDTGYLNF